mgnify:CR=1 FL=1
MSLFDAQAKDQKPFGGELAHGVTQDGIAKPILVDNEGRIKIVISNQPPRNP